MEIEDIEARLDEIANDVISLSVERDELIRLLHGVRSSRQVAAICGKSHAYVCRIWREKQHGSGTVEEASRLLQVGR